MTKGERDVPTELPDLPVPDTGKLLQEERARATFDPRDLSHHIYGKQGLEVKNRIVRILQNDIAMDKTEKYNLGRPQAFRMALMRAKRLAQLAKEHKWSDEEIQIADAVMDESAPFGLHKHMYLITLRGQCTPEQKKSFLEPAEAYEHIGCYAQTELGHGSNVQGLETTATYDHNKREFVLNSPTLTSTKWWIGSLGRTANHAIVMAQLIIDDKSYGPHPFVVQVRDLSTHKPLKGVTVGDIGPKAGYNTMDNGFMLFDHVRIPHLNMLAKYSNVDENGKYQKPPQAKLAYGTLTWVRSRIVMEARLIVARSATVALRYTAIRRQFIDRDSQKDGSETQTLDYSMVQYRLLPVMAQAFALHYTGSQMAQLYMQNQKQMAGGNFDLLADLHSSSSGLKSLSTLMASDAIESCRRAMGGHGFSMYSGLAHVYQDYLPNVTWEGDNYMLTQQVARYLLKVVRSMKENTSEARAKNQSNPITGYLAVYLDDPRFKGSSDLYNTTNVLSMFSHRAATMAVQVWKLRDQDKCSWNSLLVDFYNLSVAHCQYIMLLSYADGIKQSNVNDKTRDLLSTLFSLFAFHTIESKASEFLVSGSITLETLGQVKREIMKILAKLRPNAVALTDAWDFPDFWLQSSLGRSDGKVYQDMFLRAARNPLNDFVVNPDFRQPVLVQGEKPSPEVVAMLTQGNAKPKL